MGCPPTPPPPCGSPTRGHLQLSDVSGFLGDTACVLQRGSGVWGTCFKGRGGRTWRGRASSRGGEPGGLPLQSRGSPLCMGEGASEARIWAFPVAASVQTCVASLPKKAFRGLRPRAQLTARSGFRVTLGKVTHRLAMCPHLTLHWVGNPGDKPRGFGCAGASVLGWVQLPSWEATSGGDPSAPVRLPGCRPGPRGPESLPRGRKNDLSHLCLTTPTPAWQQRGARMDRGESVVKAGTVTVRAQDGQGAGQGWEDVAAMGTEVGEWLDRVGAAPQSKSPPRCSKVPPGPVGRVLPCPPSRAARGWGSCLH